ncbi:hypothetical protein [Catellatospora sp. IY07-71]|nr:hypothetical protein [Catellatospora sp. IY07-71]
MSRPRMSPVAAILTALLTALLAVGLCLLARELIGGLTDLGGEVPQSLR